MIQPPPIEVSPYNCAQNATMVTPGCLAPPSLFDALENSLKIPTGKFLKERGGGARLDSPPLIFTPAPPSSQGPRPHT